MRTTMTSMVMPQLHVGRGAQVGPLTVFPVWASTPGPVGLVTGRAARVRVAEREGSPVVGELVVTNVGDRPVLLVEGELLEGGWQHRVLQHDLVLAAAASMVAPVACVEAGRWHGGGGHARRARRASGSVRAALQVVAPMARQQEVWRRVAGYDAAMGPSATSSFVDHLDRLATPAGGSDSSQSRTTGAGPELDVAVLVRQLRALRPIAGQRGVLVGVGGQPVLLELYPSTRALAAHLGELLTGLLLDAVATDAPIEATPGTAGPPDGGAARRPGGHPGPRTSTPARASCSRWTPSTPWSAASPWTTPGRTCPRSTASTRCWRWHDHHPAHGARLSPAQTDRAAGVLLGLACGDALGAGYEFAPARIHGEPVAMAGGGSFGWAPGEWTDDTSMAVVIAQVAATGVDLRSTEALDAITERFVAWADEATDVGVQTRQVLSAVRATPTAAAATAQAAEAFARTGRTGNGSLMRTAPVALAYLDDPDGLTEAAHAVSALTHGDEEAGEACALWCHAIAHAVRHGTFDGLRLAVAALPPDRAAVWTARLDHAEAVPPHAIPANGWVVAALQAAWSAISRTPVPDDDPAAGVFAAEPLRARARGGGPRRRRHRHGRGDRRRPARRPVGCLRRAAGVAAGPARLAGAARPRPDPARPAHRPGRALGLDRVAGRPGAGLHRLRRRRRARRAPPRPAGSARRGRSAAPAPGQGGRGGVAVPARRRRGPRPRRRRR